MDVLFVMSAFEQLNKVRLGIVLQVTGTEVRPVLEMIMTARDRADTKAEAPPLACKRCLLGSIEPRTLESAILQGLYSIDALLAETEFAKAHTK